MGPGVCQQEMAKRKIPSLPVPGIEPGRPARSLISMLTELPWLPPTTGP